MEQTKLRGVLAAVAGVLALGAVAPAMADNNDDIIYTLMAKGVLTEEEGHQLLNGREKERATEQKTMKSAGKITVADFIDNATVYGDIRVRAEHRDGEDNASSKTSEDRDRARYKITFGIKTKANDFYTDLALAMGGSGRSDNATFGSSSSDGINKKETLFVKRAMIGWKTTDWLTLEAGRVNNPLYTTPMVWDGDLPFEGLVEKLNFKAGNANIFFNLAQANYVGDDKEFSPSSSSDNHSDWMMVMQGGAKFPITDNVAGKVALTYTKHSNDKKFGTFTPVIGSSALSTGSLGNNTYMGINDLTTIEVPFEVDIKTGGALSWNVFGDYVHNIDGSDRAKAACAANATISCSGDYNAWMLGAGLKSGKGKGAWDAKLWYQDVGAYSVDPNAVDSDFMDSRVNMKGVVFKGGYNLRENVVLNFAAGHGSRKDKSLSAIGSGDLGVNLDKFNLYQLDMTYKF